MKLIFTAEPLNVRRGKQTLVTTNNIVRKRSNVAPDQTSADRKTPAFFSYNYCLTGGQHKIKTIYNLTKKVFRINIEGNKY